MPPENFYGFRSDFSDVKVNILTGALRSQIADAVVPQNQLRYAIYEQSYREMEPGVGPIVAPGTPLSSVTVTRNVQLNVNNIANRRYYDGLDDNHVNVSAGRSAVLSLIVDK